MITRGGNEIIKVKKLENRVGIGLQGRREARVQGRRSKAWRAEAAPYKSFGALKRRPTKALAIQELAGKRRLRYRMMNGCDLSLNGCDVSSTASRPRVEWLAARWRAGAWRYRR